MDRKNFLARIAEASEKGRQYRVSVPAVPKEAGYVGARGELCQSLADEITFVGGEPQVVPNWEAARTAVAQLLKNYEARSVLCWQHSILDRIDLSALLSQLAIETHDYSRLMELPPEERKLAALAAAVGISSADFAIAETGTLVVCAKPGQERLSSLITPVHIAVISRQQIVPDLFDLFDQLRARGWENLPSNVALISGPSKTGDIELELTTGVHGPGRWHVVIVDTDQDFA